MGFGINQSIWAGPVLLKFKYDRDHTKTIRYRCDLEKHAFHFYAPLFMLHGLSPGKIPERLEVTLGRSKNISPLRSSTTRQYLAEWTTYYIPQGQ